MSRANEMDGRENSYEIYAEDILESYIDRNEDLQRVQNYMWCKISKLRSCFEMLGSDAYIRDLNELDDTVLVLVEVTVGVLVSAILHEPMAQAVIEDGLKDKPREYVDYFEKLKECGLVPFFQPYPDYIDPDVN